VAEDLAVVQAAAAMMQCHLETRLAAGRECDGQQLAAVVAAHRRVVSDILGDAAEAQHPAAASGGEVILLRRC
jgi:hypothetical protein